MFSLIRTGPRILLMKSNEIEKLRTYISESLDGSECSIDTAFEEAGEDYVILLLIEELRDIVRHDDVNYIFILRKDADIVMSTILNDNKANLINKVRLAPRILIMRGFGDLEKILNEVQKDHHSNIGGFIDILDASNDKGTIIAFTQKPLTQNLSLSDLYEKVLLVDENYYPLIRNLRMFALKYLNEGIANKDWYELDIKIYDVNNKYNLHYLRLLNVLESLGLGLILGEAWGKERTTLFKTVEVYRVRFFTFYEPKFVKKILLGLEYLDEKRIVNYDLYHGKTKINWSEAIEGDIVTRSDLGDKYRDYIFSKLGYEERQEVLRLEQQIMKS